MASRTAPVGVAVTAALPCRPAFARGEVLPAVRARPGIPRPEAFIALEAERERERAIPTPLLLRSLDRLDRRCHDLGLAVLLSPRIRVRTLRSARTPYALRHTFASFAIVAGLPTFEIARMMGTSIEQIEKTYGHLLPDALERGRAALEAFDAKSEAREAAQDSVQALNGSERFAPITAEKALSAGPFFIGAPRFELGTSSPGGP
jgi:hypothetical protein